MATPSLAEKKIRALALLEDGWDADQVCKKLNVKERHLSDWTLPKIPNTPTQAMPGSAEKIEIMRQRVEQGYSVDHSDDVRI